MKKQIILEKLGNGFDDVATDSGVKRWEAATRIAAQYEDSEVMNKMLNLVQQADGGPAEALPVHLFKVYEKNPIFYLKSALAQNGGRMDAIALSFMSEVHGASLAQIEAPLKTVSAKNSDFKFVEKFRHVVQEQAKAKK